MLKLSEIAIRWVHLYEERSPKGWWKGRFDDFSIIRSTKQGFVLGGLDFHKLDEDYRESIKDQLASNRYPVEISERIKGDTFWRCERVPFYYGGDKFGLLESFSLLENGVYKEYPIFSLIVDSIPYRGSYKDHPADEDSIKVRLSFDSVGYSASIVEGGVICYHPLMLPPSEQETGACIGGIQRFVPFGKRLSVLSVISPEALCERMQWQDLVKYAKPYSDYFAAAGVSEVKAEKFRSTSRNVTYRACPLYIGKRCIAVKIGASNSLEEKYISYEEYKDWLDQAEKCFEI